MKITLLESYFGNFCFGIRIKENVYHTSERISKVLNLDLDTYNHLLVKKVIQHRSYYISNNPFPIPNHDKHLTFDLNNISKETYIERFKNTFNKELILLVLGNG